MAEPHRSLLVSPSRTWLSAAGAVALVVIAIQFVWRMVLLGQGYFSQDDFLAMSSIADRSGLSALAGDYAGGFSPGGSAIVGAGVALAPLNWSVAAASVLVLQSAATAMLWLVLTQMLGDRWLRVPLFVMFAVSPLTLWSTQGWVLGVEFWAATLLGFLAIWAVLGSARSGDRRLGALAVIAVGLAMLFDERAVLTPVVVFGVLLITSTAPSARARLARVGSDHGVVLLGLAGTLLGYAVLRWQVAPIDLRLGNEMGEVVTGYLRHSVAELLGGPWTGNLPSVGHVIPLSWVVALNGALLLAIVGSTLQHGGTTTRLSWGLLVAYLVGAVGVLTLSGRADLLASLGLIHRFGAEVAPVAVVCLAGALRDVTFPEFSVRWRGPVRVGLEPVVAVAGTIAVAVAAAVSTAFLASNQYHPESRAFVETLRSELRDDPQVVLLDGGVPDEVISAWFGSRATVSTIAGVASEDPVFDLPSHSLRAVREDGSLAPVALGGAVRTAPSADSDCGYPVRSVGTLVPMQAQVPDGRWVLRIGYYTSVEGFAVVQVAGAEQRFAVRPGLNAIDLVVNGGFINFRMTLEDPGATLCLTDASAGVPIPEGP